LIRHYYLFICFPLTHTHTHPSLVAHVALVAHYVN
jgi:hypothetical protein